MRATLVILQESHCHQMSLPATNIAYVADGDMDHYIHHRTQKMIWEKSANINLWWFEYVSTTLLKIAILWKSDIYVQKKGSRHNYKNSNGSKIGDRHKAPLSSQWQGIRFIQDLVASRGHAFFCHSLNAQGSVVPNLLAVDDRVESFLHALWIQAEVSGDWIHSRAFERKALIHCWSNGASDLKWQQAQQFFETYPFRF